MMTKDELQAWLMNWINKETKIPENSINIERSFSDYGLDSLEAAILTGDLSDMFPDAYFEPSMFWEIKNIKELSEFIIHEVVVEAQ
jgi:acyl carrier protein